MINKAKNILFFFLFFIFFFFVTKYYFSEKNVIDTNKSRSTYSITSLDSDLNIPILKSDTDNIIVYKNGVEEFKQKRKKRFWEKLISNTNEK